jgi:excisionase family DNA binding protein
MSKQEDQLKDIKHEIMKMQRQISRLTQLTRANVSTLLSLDEASLYTGYAKGYLYKLTAQGDIPCYRPTKRRVFIDREELERWIRSNSDGINK